MTRSYVVNVDVAVHRGDEYLFIVRGEDESHAPGTVSLPGGTIEAPAGREDAIERTAVREVREEVGVDIEEVRYLASSTFEADDGSPCLNVVCLARYADGDAHRAAADEVAAVEWRAADDVLGDESVPPWTREFVAAAERARRS